MSNIKLKELRKLAADNSRLFSLIGTDIVELDPGNWIQPNAGTVYYLENGTWQYQDTKEPNKWNTISTPPAALLAYTGTTSKTTSKPAASKAANSNPATPITHQKGTYLVDDAYHYFVNGPLSFNWWPLNDRTKIKEFTSASKTWEAAVKAINLLPPVAGANSTATTTEAKQPQATSSTEAATPAAETAAAPASNLDPTLVGNVQAILMRASKEALYVGSAQDEKGRINEMFGMISQEIGQTTSPSSFLAQLIVARRGTTLAQLGLGSVSAENIAVTERKDLAANRNGAYSKITSSILQEVNSIYSQYTAAKKTGFFKSIKHTITPPAAATPIPPATSAKYPAKIIRLASLRRLRVKSEMLAAITGSAMPGRDRVV